MPKIRGIKPDYWTDEDIVELSIPARLLFIGLWTYACDNGHLDDKPKQIKMRVFPADAVDVDPLLTELVDNGRIERDKGTITIHRFAHHQKPHSRWWSTCDLPFCHKPGGATTGAAPRVTGSHNSGATVDHEGPQGATAVVDGDGDGDGDRPRKRATKLPSDWQPSDAHGRLAAERGVDVVEEAAKFRDWCAGNGATKKDWEATFRNWIRNARPTGNVRHLRPETDDQGRTVLPPLPPRNPWSAR